MRFRRLFRVALWALASMPLASGCGHSPAAAEVLVNLSGTVSETAPTQTRMIAGALVQVVGGTSVSAATDSQGHFSLAGIPPEVDLQISAAGYATRTVHIKVPADGSSAALQIGPAPAIVTETSGSTSGGLFNGNSVVVPVHDAGEIVITDLKFYGFEEGDSLTLQILSDGQLITQNTLERSFPRNTVALRAAVEGGHMIEVRAANGFYWTFLSFTHPR